MMTKQHIAIAIDGPSAAGKSTMARQLAQRLGYLYVDTGALYRTIGCYAWRNGCDCTEAERVVAMLPDIAVTLRYVAGEQRVLLNGEDVSEEIRRPEMSMQASRVSAIPQVRAFLLELQRSLARENDVVMDGRDIATVVLPDAQVKFFLTASAEERARRRLAEFAAKGQSADYSTLLAELRERDYNDTHRAAAPLRQAEDAIPVDSTGMSLAQTVERMLTLTVQRLAALQKNGGQG